VSRRHSAAEPQPETTEYGRQNDGKIERGKNGTEICFDFKKVTKKTGKPNTLPKMTSFELALRGVVKGRVGGRQNAESHGKGAKDAK